MSLWWSGDSSFEESIPALHWRSEDRQKGEGTLIPLCRLRSPCVTVGGAGCTLPDGLESMLSLTVVGIGAVAWKPSRDSGCSF